MKFLSKLFAVFFVLGAVSCETTDEPLPTDPFEEMVIIYSGPVGMESYKFDVYMLENPFVGFNNIYVDVYDSVSNIRVTDWELTYAPMMTMMTDMGSMMHTCPLEQPQHDTELSAYAGAAVFIMPTTEMGMWKFELKYENTIASGSVSFPLTVVEKDNPAMVSFVSEADEAVKYFVALIEPGTPDVGVNEFEVGIYVKESMMSFPAIGSQTVVIEPEMPSMGHGSPDNVDPVDSGNGHYKGNVNFTMTGLWRVHMEIKNADGQIVTTDSSFDIEF